MAGLARALKHGPRRSFGKSRHADTDPSSSKVAPVTKPKPKSSSKGGSDEKEEKSGGFLFRRRSFNEKKTTTGDDDSYKGSPKVSKKFGLKIGGSGNKKPPVKSKPGFSSTSTGENDSILSEDIPQANSTTSTPSKTFEPPSPQKTSTPAKENSTPPSRRERTPGERDSSLFKDPPSLFGHRSVLFGSAEFDAIFEKYAKEDEDASKASEPGDNSSETKQSDTRLTPDRKPTPSKKPEVSTKPNWMGRGSTSSDKSSEQKSTGSRVSEGRALFEKPKPSEDIVPIKPRRGFSQFSKYEINARGTEAKKVEEKVDEVKEKEKAEETKDGKMEVTEDESNTKSPLFDDDAMVTEKIAVEAKLDTKKSLFGKYETGSATTDLFKDEDDDDELFGGKNRKEAGGTAKKNIYGALFSTEETTSTVRRSGSLFDEEPSDDDELFSTTKKPQKTDDSVKALDLGESASTTVEGKKEAKVASPLADEDESPLFGKPKSPSPDLFSKEEEGKEEKDKEPVEDDVLMDTDKDKIKDETKNEKEPDSPGLFDKPSSPLFEDKSEVQRSTSIFEGKRSESEEDLFHMDQKGKEPDTSNMRETDVSGGFLLVDVEKKKEETRSSLFDDDKLCYDDSDVLPKLEKENKGLFAIDDFVMVSKQEDVITESAATVENTSSDPLSDEKKEKSDEMALEDFPPKKSATEDVPQKETSKEPEKEKQSNEVSVDSIKSRIRHGSADKKRDLSLKDEKKSSDDDKPAWMVEAQRRKERRLLEKEKEKEKKLQATKEKSPTTKRHTTEQSKMQVTDLKLKKSNISTTTSVTKKPVVEDDMPEWQKKLMERKQRVAEQKKTGLSSRETTYTSRRDTAKDTVPTTVTTTASSSVQDKKKEEDTKKEEDKKKEDEKVEEKEQKETEEEPRSETADEEKEKSKSPPFSPVPEKPLLSPKPKLDEVKSPTRTTSVSSSKPELKKKPSVEVTISSTKRETRRSSGDQEKDQDRSKESPAKELENGTEKSSPISKRRIPSTSDKKTVSVSSKVSTSVSSTRTSSTSSDTSVPKWKRDLQQKKAEPEKKDKGGRDAAGSPTSQDSIPEWKRQLLEKRKQRRTPTPTDDKEVRNI